MYNLVSLTGLALFPALAWLLSTNRRGVNGRVVAWGIGLQLLFAVFVFLIPIGPVFFLAVNDGVVRLLDSSTAGSEFLFGRLAVPPGSQSDAGEPSLGFILAFQALPAIVFFSALIAVLYYTGIMPVIIRAFARVFTRLMRISGAESLCAASNIFVGVESMLTVRPHLNSMTRSELCTILTAGMATVASNVLAFYTFMVRDSFPTIAGHLVSASILSAPAALAMSKILLPESEEPETLGVDVHPHYERDSSVFEAVINGANAGLRLVLGIAALLLAVLGLVDLADLLLAAAGGGINALTGLSADWSLTTLLGWVFYPVTLVMGVHPEDAGLVAELLGGRIILTEAVSYKDLAGMLAADAFGHPRSIVIAAYALCGFAHVAAIAIFVGGAAAIAPDRSADLARVAPRALLAATLACLMTGCIAGLFMTDTTVLFGP